MAAPTPDRVVAELAVLSRELTPELISERVGLESTRSWRAGEPLGSAGQVWPVHGWRLHREARPRPDQELDALIPVVLDDLLAEVAFAAERFRLLQAEGAQVTLQLHSVGSYAPHLSFTPEQLAAIATLGATLRIDLATYRLSE